MRLAAVLFMLMVCSGCNWTYNPDYVPKTRISVTRSFHPEAAERDGYTVGVEVELFDTWR